MGRSSLDAKQEGTSLPRRDLILLPMLSLLTVLFLVGSTEFVARRIFTTTKATGVFGCLVFDDPIGVRAIPNSVCQEKAPEGEQMEYRFNSCGHRAGMECGPKPAGVYRIVTLGSSMTLGAPAAREKTFAALLPIELSRLTGRKVELYNEAMSFRYPDQTASHFNEILSEDPDLILWTLNPVDLQRVPPELSSIAGVPRPLTLSQWVSHAAKGVSAAKSLSALLGHLFERTRTRYLLLDVLYDASQSLYVSASLMESDEKVGYLRTQPTQLWQKRLHGLDGDIANVEDLARKAHVPLVTVLLPRHAEASMVSMGTWPDGFNPYQLDQELRSLVTRNGGIYVDILPHFRYVSNPQLYYYPVDTHYNPKGHIAVADFLAKELAGAVPQLKSSAVVQSTLVAGK